MNSSVAITVMPVVLVAVEGNAIYNISIKNRLIIRKQTRTLDQIQIFAKR